MVNQNKIIASRVKQASLFWRKSPISKRLQVLKSIEEKLVSNKNKLQELFLEENNLTNNELAKRFSDISLQFINISFLKQQAYNLVKFVKTQTNSEILVRKADGVVLALIQGGIPAFSFVKLFSTLLVGNGLLVLNKTTINLCLHYIIEEIIQPTLKQYDFSPDLVILLKEDYQEFLKESVTNIDIDTVLYLDNNIDNNEISRLFQKNNKKVIIENNLTQYLVIWKDSNVQILVSDILRGLNAATNLSIPRYFLVHDEIYDEFITGLLKEISKIATSYGVNKEDSLTSVSTKLNFYLAKKSENIGKIVFGGSKIDSQFVGDSHNYVLPTLIELESNSLTDESFCFNAQDDLFPVSYIVRFKGSDQEILEKILFSIKKDAFGCYVSLWTKTLKVIEDFSQTIDLNILSINNYSPLDSCALLFEDNKNIASIYEQTSKLQKIDSSKLSETEIQNILSSLGGGISESQTKSLTESKAVSTTIPKSIVVNEETNLSQTLAGLEFSIDSKAIAKIIFNRPERHNAITAQIKDSLNQVTENLQKMSSNLRCVVITGKGRSFCSGADLKDLTSFTSQQAKEFMISATWAFRRFEKLPVPVIAAVKGFCMGGGFELALHCDEIIASQDTKFKFPETGIGIVTTAGAVSRLIAAVGLMRARPLLIGKEFTAKEAYDMGLVSKVVEAEELETAVNNRCLEILKQPAEGIKAMKEIINNSQKDQDTLSWICEIETFDRLVQVPWQEFVSNRLKKG
jgi:enoyl-CoA hydratase/carnithine racemase/acyl-CoA reductase-like NAD-dependent aldehyde dehydrogenase